LFGSEVFGILVGFLLLLGAFLDHLSVVRQQVRSLRFDIFLVFLFFYIMGLNGFLLVWVQIVSASGFIALFPRSRTLLELSL